MTGLPGEQSIRRYDIDFIRVIAFALLIFYHVGMFFVPWYSHLKNDIVYPELEYPMYFLNQWRLSLLFLISGMGTWFALSRKNTWQFVKERFVRLFIPLVVGMIFIVPPQIYFERLDQGQVFGSYFDFWPLPALETPYPEGGGLSWHHLWFILYLFIFSVLLSPALTFLRKKKNSWLIQKSISLSTKGVGLYLYLIPLFFCRLYLEPYYPQTNGLFGDWFNLVNYCTLFFFGFLLIAAKDQFWQTVINSRKLYLVCGIIGFTGIVVLEKIIPDFIGKDLIYSFTKVFNMWSWILAIMGYAATYFNKPTKWLNYANEAVYPFYILHQTVIIVLGYYLKYNDMGFFLKFSIMSLGTFGITWLIYEFGIRRYNIIRPLFGMKIK